MGDIETLRAENERLRMALIGLLAILDGRHGNWPIDDEPEVIAAKAALYGSR